MREKYITPEIEIIAFDTEDVIETSNPASTEESSTEWPWVSLN